MFIPEKKIVETGIDDNRIKETLDKAEKKYNNGEITFKQYQTILENMEKIQTDDEIRTGYQADIDRSINKFKTSLKDSFNSNMRWIWFGLVAWLGAILWKR